MGSESFDKLRACPEFIEGTNGKNLKTLATDPFMLSLSKHSSNHVVPDYAN
jgi:hypothetical protein